MRIDGTLLAGLILGLFGVLSLCLQIYQPKWHRHLAEKMYHRKGYVYFVVAPSIAIAAGIIAILYVILHIGGQ